MMYHSPHTLNNQWRPFYDGPRPRFQRRPHTNFIFKRNLTSESTGENWCETCDREFPTAEILSKHKQQHEKCNIDGCQFVAHPKVITKHIQMQHSSGLYKKIAKLQNPEEIQKWREERKKRYPTRHNIENKAAECKEKIERGEKMALKKDRFNCNTSSDPQAGLKRKHCFDKKNLNQRSNKSCFNQRQNTYNQKNPHPLKKIPKIIPKVPIGVGKNKLMPFTGILSICMDDYKTEDMCNSSGNKNSLIEDDYYEEVLDQPIEMVSQEPVLCGALTSLMCDYGSSDEENNKKGNDMSSNLQISEGVLAIDSVKRYVETIIDNNTSKQVNTEKNNLNKHVVIQPNTYLDKEVSEINELNKNNSGENSDNHSGPEEVETVKMDIVELTLPKVLQNQAPHVNVKKYISAKNIHKHNNQYKHKVPSTLLEKLLHKEIRQERNIILQCIRYIKKMKYFDKTLE